MTSPPERTILGHPIGLAYLVFAEAWERFSYYGMQALLVLYMSQQLFLPGTSSMSQALRHSAPPSSSVWSAIAGRPGFGDLWSVRRWGVPDAPCRRGHRGPGIGPHRHRDAWRLSDALGHFLMAFENLVPDGARVPVGRCGLFQGQHRQPGGELYAPGNLRRADAFQIFMLGIQVAVIVSPLVCGTLGRRWPGIGGSAPRVSGCCWVWPSTCQAVVGCRRNPPARVAVGRPVRAKLTRANWVTIVLLTTLIPSSRCRRWAIRKSSTPISSGVTPTTG